MVEAGDEFFTTSFCDLLRLCICPLLLSSIWFLFLHSIRQIDEVFGEVDDALRNKRYQITYAAITDGKKGKKKKKAEPVAAAAFLPAPSKTVSTANSPQTPAQQNAGATAVQSSTMMSPAEIAFASKSPEERAAAEATITDAATEIEQENNNAERHTEQFEPQAAVPEVPQVTVLPEESLIQQGGTTMAFVADIAEPETGMVSGVRVVPVVQEFNPFPEGNVPVHNAKKPQNQHKQGQKRPNNGQKNRQGGQKRPNGQGNQNRQGGQNHSGNAQNRGASGAQRGQNRSGGQGRPNNQNRSGHR